jgi:hypothetical protein
VRRENFIEHGPNRAANFDRAIEKRDDQVESAALWLATGKGFHGVDPPYGKEFDRTYNPSPYPEAAPDPETYEGTGIGFLYGLDSTVDGRRLKFWAVQLAGWILTRDGVEVRKTSVKVDKKELVPEEDR